MKCIDDVHDWHVAEVSELTVDGVPFKRVLFYCARCKRLDTQTTELF